MQMQVDKNTILDLTNRVTSYEGKMKPVIFGGFIRDFLFYTLNNLPRNRSTLKDLDLWISDERNEVEEKHFLNHFVRGLYNWKPDFEPKRSLYEFTGLNVVRYTIYDLSDRYLFTIDLVYCKNFPVNDLSVNLLSYDGSFHVHNTPNTSYTVEDIFGHLKTHTVDILQGPYTEGVKDDYDYGYGKFHVKYTRLEGILRRFTPNQEGKLVHENGITKFKLKQYSVLIHFICKSVGDHHAPFGNGEPDRFYYIPSCQLKTPEEIERFYNREKTLPDGKWLSFKDTLTLGCTNVIEMKYKSEIFSPFNKYITCN